MRRPSPLPTPPKAPSDDSPAGSNPSEGRPSGTERPSPPPPPAGLPVRRLLPGSAGAGHGRREGDSDVSEEAVSRMSVPTRRTDDDTLTDDDTPAPRTDAVAPDSAGRRRVDPRRWLQRRDVWRAARARRRLLRAEMRRFTLRQRRRRAVWLAAGASLVILALGSVGAAYSPLFAVRDIQVQGVDAIDRTEIVDALHGQVGTPLPLVSDEAVKAALVEFPLVQSYTLQARPPHDLIVRIVERTPVGVVKSKAGYTLVDAAGVALSTARKAPKGQPRLTIDGGVHSDAFRSAGQVIRSLPASVRAKVTAVSAGSIDDVTLTLGKTGTKVMWGSADQSSMKAIVLQKIMKARPADTVKEYDVSSVPSAVVVR